VQSETVTNTGSVPVLINGVALAGTNVADFSETNNCGSSLAAGANCVINVSVTPGQLGPSSAAITITDSTVASPHAVALNGMGLTSGPNASLYLAGKSLTLPLTLVGTTSPALSLKLSNYGTAALSLAGITVTANFGESDNCGSSLASAASCTINLTFTPPAVGTVTGTLSITDNASGSPQTVSLSGTGTKNSFTGACLVVAGNICQVSQNACSAGHPAQYTGSVSCVNGGTYGIDSSAGCKGFNRAPGVCIVN
jgi:hypothetical protein